jgi:hypothetical protein
MIRVALAVIALAGAAHAEPRVAAAPPPPDSAVDDAADANLESIADRRGLTFDAAVGGGLVVGLGIKDSVGRGGSVSLRLGHVATRRTVINFNLDVTAALHKEGSAGSVYTNTAAAFSAGARTYLNTSLWVRGAGGLGIYDAHQVALENGQHGDVRLFGPAVLAGLGIDLARFKWAVLALDTGVTAILTTDGVLVTSGLRLGLSFD